MLKSSLAGAVGALSVPSLLAEEPAVVEKFAPASAAPFLFYTAVEEIRCSSNMAFDGRRKVVLCTEKDGDPRCELSGLSDYISLDMSHFIHKYSRPSGEVFFLDPGFPRDCGIILRNFCCPKSLLDSWLPYAADVSVPISVGISPDEEATVFEKTMLGYVRNNWLSRLTSISCCSVDAGMSVINDLRFACRLQQPFPSST